MNAFEARGSRDCTADQRDSGLAKIVIEGWDEEKIATELFSIFSELLKSLQHMQKSLRTEGM
jgi:hypothetical protein